jgi:GntR family transcriptional regulator
LVVFLPVDPTSGLPVYRQVMDQVRRTIASGHLRVGERLPSIRDLATTLKLNPLTVGKAYAELERSGLVEMRRGLGMYVRSKPEGGRTGDPGSPAGVIQAAERLVLESAQAGLTCAQTVRVVERCWRDLRVGAEPDEGGRRATGGGHRRQR